MNFRQTRRDPGPSDRRRPVESPPDAENFPSPSTDARALSPRIVLAGCRAAWHEPLHREAKSRLGASVLAFEDSPGVVGAACALLVHGKRIDLVILEGAAQRAVHFFRRIAPEVPVLVLADEESLELRIRAATGGAAAFVAHPATISEILRIGDRIMQTSAEVARRAGIPLPLRLIRGAAR